ncbi:MAG: glycerol dehydratase reactivase beta/small subunit family protein [Anaerolineales bacterium]|nr:glycerol dehydratase reactivase beta/small subunit family protein [Anaerolineales bacterium]
MAPFAQERPCIHVAFLAARDKNLYRWVQIGAEEEGVPCKLVTEKAANLVALAYEAAKSSRFNIGVGVSSTEIVLHEMHMPPTQPVLTFRFSGQANYFCRLMGANAARMIIRKPFRFDDKPAAIETKKQILTAVESENKSSVPSMQTEPPKLTFDPVQIAKVIAVVLSKLEERGIR